jgi:hypothetical protein
MSGSYPKIGGLTVTPFRCRVIGFVRRERIISGLHIEVKDTCGRCQHVWRAPDARKRLDRRSSTNVNPAAETIAASFSGTEVAAISDDRQPHEHVRGPPIHLIDQFAMPTLEPQPDLLLAELFLSSKSRQRCDRVTKV